MTLVKVGSRQKTVGNLNATASITCCYFLAQGLKTHCLQLAYCQLPTAY